MSPLWIALVCVLTASVCTADDGDLKCVHEEDASTFAINARVGVRTAAETRQEGKADYPFRLKIIYDDSIENRTDKDFIKETYVEPAKQFWINALRVKYPLNTKILKTRSCSSSWTTLDKDNKTKTFCIGNSCSATTTCSGFVFPEKYLAKCEYCTSKDLNTCTSSGTDGEGVDDADLVIFVLSANVSSCPDAAAYANTCERENEYFRSIVAVINICPPQLYGGYDPYAMRGLLKHEIMHTLGMSRSSYGLYVDENGNRYSETDPATGLPVVDPATQLYQWSDKIVIQKPVEWETPKGTYMVNRTIMVAPLVQQEVSRHFDCPDLEGAELENQGGSGTQWSHLEKRIFAAENIGGVRTESQNVSRISLAIMQSTGWYNANWTAAEIYYWGQGLGCNFARKSCYAYIRDQRAANRDPAPYCDVLSRRTVGDWWHTTCDLTRNYPTECNLRYVSALIAPQYQYFTDIVTNGQAGDDPTRYGGGVEYTDYCPYLRQQILPSPNIHHNRYRRCKDPSLQLPVELDPYLESYGLGTCVRQGAPFITYLNNTDPSTGNKTVTWGSGCYEIRCQTTSVTLLVKDQELVCRRELEHVSFDILTHANSRTRGELICPLCEHACIDQPCPMQRFNATVLDTYDRSRTITDPIIQTNTTITIVEPCSTSPAVQPITASTRNEPNVITSASPSTEDLMPVVIGLAVAAGVLLLTTIVFAILYFKGRSLVKNLVEPQNSSKN